MSPPLSKRRTAALRNNCGVADTGREKETSELSICFDIGSLRGGGSFERDVIEMRHRLEVFETLVYFGIVESINPLSAELFDVE